MELKEGTGLARPTGRHMGRIRRVVLHPGINELPHIAIQRFWLLPDDQP